MASIQDRFMREAPPLADRYITGVNADYTVPVYALRVDAATVSGGSAFSITMPDPSEAAGATITVYMTARDATKNITVKGTGMSNITLDAANEYTVLHSDGVGWCEFAKNHA